MKPSSRLETLGITLPVCSNPAANYTNCKQAGELLYVSGKGPLARDGVIPNGKLGAEYTESEGYEFARSAGLDILASVQDFLGTLDKVTGVLTLHGYVNADPSFTRHHIVLNGCSDLMAEVFKETGIHTRSVSGANSLRNNLPIIIESVFTVKTG